MAVSFGISVDDLMDEGREEPVQSARLFAYFLLRDLTYYSYPQIGRIMGRDHTSARSGCLRMAQLVAEDERYSTVCQELHLIILQDGLPSAAEAPPEDDPDQSLPYAH